VICLVWAYRGPHAGKVVALPDEAAVRAAESEGWGQDLRKHSAHELRAVVAEPPGEYQTRVMVARPPRNYETKGPRRGKHH
jgi:hypothetical protein